MTLTSICPIATRDVVKATDRASITQAIKFVRTRPSPLIATIGMLMAFDVAAAPAVEGNTISWPDDGWYQVQRQSDQVEVCAGTRDCTVLAGSYIVINHHTGQRWNDVQVTDSSSNVDGVTVDGNTLSWPDDGWYQVQRASDYQEICGGGTQCVVPDGIYNVINHTTGERWNSISVMASGGGGTGGGSGSDETPTPVADIALGLPPIVGTALPGQNVGTRTLSVDGWEKMNYHYQSPLLPDIDGDGIAELYTSVQEAGQPCSTLLYLPSRQSYSPVIQTSDLSSYTRIRNYGISLLDDGSVQCEDESQEFHALGDIDADGISDFAVRYAYNGSLVISGAIPNGTLVTANAPTTHAFFVEKGISVVPVGDFNGDGAADLALQADGDNLATEAQSCVLVAGGQEFPDSLGSDDFASLTLLGQRPLSSYQRCDLLESAGDVNGDNADDLLIMLWDDDSHWRILEGGEQARVDDLTSAYPIESDCNLSNVDCHTTPVGDVDADGYDDLFVTWSNTVRYDNQIRSSGVLLYGGVDGLQNLSHSAFPPIRRSQLVASSIYNAFFPTPMGDLNGDGASDFGRLDRVFLGTPGRRSPYLLAGIPDGNNIIARIEETPSYSVVPVDMDGDGIDDFQSRAHFVRGEAVNHRADDPASLFIWRSADHLELNWTLPEGRSDIDALRILWDDDILARIDTDTHVNRYRIERSRDEQDGIVRVQTLNEQGEIIGELIRRVGSLGSDYTDIEASLAATELTALGDLVSAADYTLRADQYSDTLAELFWDANKRFVLVWRDNEIIARTEANSMMIDAAEFGSGRYFVTIDYFGDVPENTEPFVGYSSTLARSNVVNINFTKKREKLRPSGRR